MDLNTRNFNIITERLNWSYTRKKQWIIYGANASICEECTAPPGWACRNKADVDRHGFDNARFNTNPHGSRINYDRIFNGMVYRGYLTTEQRRFLEE